MSKYTMEQLQDTFSRIDAVRVAKIQDAYPNGDAIEIFLDRIPQDVTDRPALPIPARPCITRSTAQVLATLSPAQAAQVEALAQEFAEVRADHPAHGFPPSPAHAWLMEQVGRVWDFDAGEYRPA